MNSKILGCVNLFNGSFTSYIQVINNSLNWSQKLLIWLCNT